MSDSATANAPKPSSSVKLVLLGEAAVGKVRGALHLAATQLPPHPPLRHLKYSIAWTTERLTSGPFAVISRPPIC